jgi:hypothetical protein
MTTGLDKLKHIIVLMMENRGLGRSFQSHRSGSTCWGPVKGGKCARRAVTGTTSRDNWQGNFESLGKI